MDAVPPPDRRGTFFPALDCAARAFDGALRESFVRVAGELESAGEQESDQRARQSIYAAGALLRIESRARIEAASASLRERARRFADYVTRAADEDTALSLVEDDELRVQILAADLARVVRQSCPDYADYTARVRTLVPGAWEKDELNPLGARTIASAAVGAFAGLGEPAEPTLRAALLQHVAGDLARVIDETHRWLRARSVPPAPPLESAPQGAAAAGLLPQERAARQERALPQERAVPPDGAPDMPSNALVAPPSAPTHADEAGTSLAGQVARPTPVARADRPVASAPARRPQGSSALVDADHRVRASVVPALQSATDLERDAVAFAHAAGVAPYTREARSVFFGNLRTRLREEGLPPGQTAVVDVVGAMFDYVVDDRRLPEPAKPLIWRLQQPSVALALLDPAYLGDDPRSLRRLVENIGAIANAFADDLARDSELHRRLETVVRSVEVVAEALQTRSTVIARQAEHEYERAARNVTQLVDRVVQERVTLEATPGKQNRRDYQRRPDRDREQEVTSRLRDLLGERLQSRSVPESVREFLLNVWLRHLRTAFLRDGEDSAEFNVAMKVVDDLIWSLDSLKERQSRRQLAQKIPPLISLLTQGLRAMGARDEEFKPFFDELFLIHLRKMQRRQRTGDSLRGSTRSGTTVASITDDEGDPITANGPQLSGPQGNPSAAPPVSLARATPVATAARTAPVADVSRVADVPPGDSGSRSAPASVEPHNGTGQRLLEVLASIDLSDLPAVPRQIDVGPDQAVDTLQRGDWVQLAGRPGPSLLAKVAWINARRTVVLLVRHPDRRALSMRASELRDRFERGQAMRIA